MIIIMYLVLHGLSVSVDTVIAMVYKLTIVQSNDDNHVPCSICVVLMVSLSVSS